MTDIKLPEPRLDSSGNNRNLEIPLPIRENTEQYFKFSFELFNRDHPLFNLGSKEKTSEAVSGEWFIALLDCLNDVSKTRIIDLRNSKYDLHPVDWHSKNINASRPNGHEQLDYWQFRLNKGNGRVIGVKIESGFYVVWLDPHHNLINSEGYGKARCYYKPKTEYEKAAEKIEELQEEIERLNEENKEFEKLFNEYCEK